MEGFAPATSLYVSSLFLLKIMQTFLVKLCNYNYMVYNYIIITYYTGCNHILSCSYIEYNIIKHYCLNLCMFYISHFIFAKIASHCGKLWNSTFFLAGPLRLKWNHRLTSIMIFCSWRKYDEKTKILSSFFRHVHQKWWHICGWMWKLVENCGN